MDNIPVRILFDKLIDVFTVYFAQNFHFIITADSAGLARVRSSTGIDSAETATKAFYWLPLHLFSLSITCILWLYITFIKLYHTSEGIQHLSFTHEGSGFMHHPKGGIIPAQPRQPLKLQAGKSFFSGCHDINAKSQL